MNTALDLPPGFRARRAQNWVTLGFTYAAFYTGRYNLSVVNKTLSDTFGWDKGHIGWIISVGLFAYAASTFINGPLTDRFGGRRMLLIGTLGAMTFNVLFGLGSLISTPTDTSKAWLLGYFVVVFAINNYFQSFGACAIIKVNAPWFRREERGAFSGIFGAMIQGGRFLILSQGALVLLWLPWRWVFFLPAALLGTMSLLVYRFVVDSPEDAGLPQVVRDDGPAEEAGASMGFLLRRVFANPVMMSLALCSFCIGFSRQGMDQWMVRYFQEVHHLDAKSGVYQLVSSGAPFFGVLGAISAGVASDYFWHARRPPVIFICYVGQLVSFFVLSQASSPMMAAVAILGASLCISGSHGMLLGVCTMDFGGRRAVATAAGLFDGLQYCAGALTGLGLGHLLDRYGWGIWAYALMPTAAVGAFVMLRMWNLTPDTVVRVAPAAPVAANAT